MAPERENQFKMMLSDEEVEWLRALADQAGLTASDYLRQYIRQERVSLLRPVHLTEAERRVRGTPGEPVVGTKKRKKPSK